MWASGRNEIMTSPIRGLCSPTRDIWLSYEQLTVESNAYLVAYKQTRYTPRHFCASTSRLVVREIEINVWLIRFKTFSRLISFWLFSNDDHMDRSEEIFETMLGEINNRKKDLTTCGLWNLMIFQWNLFSYRSTWGSAWISKMKTVRT